MQQPPFVLVYGSEAGLLQPRTWVLQAAGFHAVPAATLADAKRAAASHAVDLLVLCHTLSRQDCRDALAWADTLPGVRRILLSSCGAPHPMPAGEVVLSQFAGARELVASARRLLLQEAVAEQGVLA